MTQGKTGEHTKISPFCQLVASVGSLVLDLVSLVEPDPTRRVRPPPSHESRREARAGGARNRLPLIGGWGSFECADVKFEPLHSKGRSGCSDNFRSFFTEGYSKTVRTSMMTLPCQVSELLLHPRLHFLLPSYYKHTSGSQLSSV